MITRVLKLLDAEACQWLRNFYDTNASKSPEKDYCGTRIITSNMLMWPQPRERIKAIWAAIQEQLEKRLQVTDLYIEALGLHGLTNGGYHPPHADNCRFDGTRWVPNHTPHRDYTGCLYLNEDFIGGEIHWPDRNVTMKPTEGLFVAFPSNRFHVHEVFPVTQGLRYSLSFWMTTNPECSLDMTLA